MTRLNRKAISSLLLLLLFSALGCDPGYFVSAQGILAKPISDDCLINAISSIPAVTSVRLHQGSPKEYVVERRPFVPITVIQEERSDGRNVLKVGTFWIGEKLSEEELYNSHSFAVLIRRRILESCKHEYSEVTELQCVPSEQFCD